MTRRLRTRIAGVPVDIWQFNCEWIGPRWAGSLAQRPRRAGQGDMVPPWDVWTKPPTTQGLADTLAQLSAVIQDQSG